MNKSSTTKVKIENYKFKKRIENTYNSGLTLYYNHSYSQALEKILKLEKFLHKNLDFLNLLGSIYLKLGNLELAKLNFEKAISINPEHINSIINLSSIFIRNKHFNEAVHLLEKGYRLDPKHKGIILNYAYSLHENKNVGKAKTVCEKAYENNNNSKEINNLLGKILIETQDLNKAETVLNEAIQIDQNYTEALTNLGHLYRIRKNYLMAENYFKKVIDIVKDNPDYLNNLGYVSGELKKFDEALQFFQKALKLQPNHINTNINLGTLYTNLHNVPFAEKHFNFVLDLDPNNLDALRNLAALSEFLGKNDKAKYYLKKCLDIDPSFFEVQKALSFQFFKDKEYNNFRKYWKSRIHINNETKTLGLYKGNKEIEKDIISNFTPSLNLEIDKKRKTGSIGKTKKILIYPEQGIGDEVFYAGFLKSFIKKYPYELVIACNERLKPIFKRSFINNKIIGVSEIASLGPTIDFEMPIGSLIEYIKFEEDNNFPQKQFLYAENNKIKKWEKIFNKLSRKPKIGISWSGGLHLNNKIRRSFPLEELMQYMPLKFDYISLQYGACENEIKTTEDKLGHKIYYWKDVDPLVSLEEQFAQISALDCVVSAQNSTLHFSGALGINSIALLPISPDYRWRNDGNSSLFYKTINCIRQSDYNSWDKVFEKIGTNLADRIKRY